MKYISILFILLIGTSTLLAQGYNTIGGIRFGTDWGITAKHRIKEKVTVEGILQSSIKREEVLISALVAKHNSLITKRFNFYTGGGLHYGFNSDPELTHKNPFGVSAIAGVEFKLAKLVASWDFKPVINVIGGEKKVYTQSGISLRYVFVKKPLLKKPLLKEPLFKEPILKKNKEKKKAAEKKKINWKFWEKW